MAISIGIFKKVVLDNIKEGEEDANDGKGMQSIADAGNFLPAER